MTHYSVLGLWPQFTPQSLKVLFLPEIVNETVSFVPVLFPGLPADTYVVLVKIHCMWNITFNARYLVYLAGLTGGSISERKVKIKKKRRWNCSACVPACQNKPFCSYQTWGSGFDNPEVSVPALTQQRNMAKLRLSWHQINLWQSSLHLALLSLVFKKLPKPTKKMSK